MHSMHSLGQTLTQACGSHRPLRVSQRGNQGVTARVAAQMKLLTMHSLGLPRMGNRRWVAGRRSGLQ